MVDAVLITRDTQGPTDDVFDELTLTYTPPSSDAETVYEGVGLVGDMPDGGQGSSTEGGQDLWRDLFRCRIPMDADVPQIGDVVTVTTAVNDPSLADRTFTITGVSGRTYAVTRILRMVERTRGPRV